MWKGKTRSNLHFKEITERVQCWEIWRGDGKYIKKAESSEKVWPKSRGLMIQAHLAQQALGLESERQHFPSSLKVQIFRFMNGVN